MPQQIPGRRPEAPGSPPLPEAEEVARQLQRLENRIETQRRKRAQLEQEYETLEQRGRVQPRNPRLRHDLERLQAAMAEVDEKIEDFQNRARELRGEPAPDREMDGSEEEPSEEGS